MEIVAKENVYLIIDYDNEKPIAFVRTPLVKDTVQQIMYRIKEQFYQEASLNNSEMRDYIVKSLKENYRNIKVEEIKYDSLLDF
jgi:hypothetical protein